MAINLNWNEIRNRAIEFSRDWAEAESEQADSQTFWNEFFEVFGIKRRRVAIFEKKVQKLGEKRGRIDLFWSGQMLAEHKSKGENLEAAFEQATDYFQGLKENELPRYVVVSDFDRVRIVDLDGNLDKEFHIKDFQKHIKLFGFIAGFQQKEIKPEDPVNLKAANIMADLHGTIEGVGYTGHQLELFMVRILFCLFADDSGLFESGIFREYLEERTREDGSDMGTSLSLLFQVMNTSFDTRQSTLDEDLKRFPYVNGGLFAESLPIVSFDSAMRESLITACAFDWSTISPAIFGSMFQSIMDPEARRNLGAHYTSEKNILKVIQPLFLDQLWDEFESVKTQGDKLLKLQEKLQGLRFMDPACGCGNFLVVTYRELRRLELAILKELHGGDNPALFGGEILTVLNVDQFYGIEIEEFPARIAEVALWLTDHQMNLELGEAFGRVPERLPLVTSAKIVHDNALLTDWSTVESSKNISYVLGNPPFVGSKYMDENQRQEILSIFPNVKGNGTLDFVSGWYVKAAEYIQGTNAEVAFVSTNSICQGEQVSILWKYLTNEFGIKINFAHKTFKWTNDAKGVAGVYCIIVGFGLNDRENKHLFEYESVSGEPHEIKVKQINPYLVDAPTEFISSKTKPICEIPEIGIGNKPVDGGNFLFTKEEKVDFVQKEPKSEKYFRRWLGSQEFLNGIERWCLWVGDAEPSDLRSMPSVMEKIEGVRKFRQSSSSKPTQKLADTPTRFHVENIPEKEYLLIPKVSSERRSYVPIGYIQPEVMSSDLVFIVKNASKYHFGILSSKMHMTWMRHVGGKLKSDYRYSKDIVYNNFPWPEDVSESHVEKIEAAVQSILKTREKYANSTLADLYDPNSMPTDLVEAHRTLDRVVDKTYRGKQFLDENDRISFLFELYGKYTKS